MNVINIGRCVGCGVVGRLVGQHEDACLECIFRRGARWLALARRVRRDAAFAREVHARILPPWREKFEALFGKPT
jgi:hypothetical protein